MEEPSRKIFLSLIIPAYNESAGIRQAIDEADEALTRLGRPFEILIVDDGSSDGTGEQVRQACGQRPWIRLIRHEQNEGYGAALRTGFLAANGERIAFTDADCQFYLDDLGSLLRLTDEHAIAAGYRADRQDSPRRRCFSWGYNLLVRTLLGTGLRDCDCALKVFRRQALEQILPESRGFFVNAEMLTSARQHGLSIVETPVRHRPRLKGESKVRLTDIPRTLATLLPFWWSQVLFPGAQSEVSGAMSTALRGPGCISCPRKAVGMAPVLLLLIVAGFLFFTRLDCPLLEPEESRYAEISRQMLAERSFVTPVLNGAAYLQKPPLFYWLVMASYQVFGVHDWAARVVPCTAGFLLVFGVYFWARRNFGAGPALWAALVLCFSLKFVYQARMVILDGLLCLCVTAALAAGHIAMGKQTRSRMWWMLSALCCGLGILTKGPVALVLVLVPLLAYQLLDRRSAALSAGQWLAYCALAAAVALPWYSTIMLQQPLAMGEFLWVHNVLRFVDPVDHAKPIWFYVPQLLLGTLPWCVVIPLALREKVGGSRSSALGFFWLAMLWPIVFFSLSECKRPAYILPAFPMMAVVAGAFLHGRLSQSNAQTSRPKVRWLAGGAVCAGVAAFAVTDWLPDYHREFGLRGQIRRHAELAADPELEVVSYPRSWESIGFYLQRSDVRAFTVDKREQLFKALSGKSRTLLFVKTESALQDLLKGLPKDLQFLPRGRQGRLTAGLIVPTSPSERETMNRE